MAIVKKDKLNIDELNHKELFKNVEMRSIIPNPHGRPQKDIVDKAIKRIAVLLTEKEERELDEYCRKRGMSKSGQIRLLLKENNIVS